MNSNSAKALFFGFLVGPVSTIVTSMLNSFAAFYIVDLLPHPLLLSLYFMLSNYIIHAGFAFLGGYTVANIAKQHAVYLAAAIAIVGIMMFLIIDWQVQVRTDFQSPLSLDHYFSIVATLPFACAGAYEQHLKNNALCIKQLTSLNTKIQPHNSSANRLTDYI